MTTQASFDEPPRSPAIVGSAVETIVWSSDATSSTSMRAPKIGPSRGGASLTPDTLDELIPRLRPAQKADRTGSWRAAGRLLVSGRRAGSTFAHAASAGPAWASATCRHSLPP